MKIDQIKTFIEKLDESVKANPKEAYDFFEKNWDQLEPFSKQVIGYLLTTSYVASLFSDNNNLEDKIYYAGILTLAEKGTRGEFVSEDEPMRKLILHSNVDKKQIAKIFYKLKAGKHILSSNGEIADAMAAIFDISANTAYSYLSDASRLEGAADLI